MSLIDIYDVFQNVVHFQKEGYPEREDKALRRTKQDASSCCRAGINSFSSNISSNASNAAADRF